MGEERREKRRRLIDDVEELVEDVNKAVREAVSRTSGAAGSVGETLRDTIQETVHGVRSVRDSVVMVRVNKESLARLDELVEAGIAGSRSEAAAFLIAEGTKARRDLFDKISEKIDEIRKAREELRRMVNEEDGESQSRER